MIFSALEKYPTPESYTAIGAGETARVRKPERIA